MTEKNVELEKFKKEIRQLIADYMASEGCGCCCRESHKRNEERIGQFLKIPKYKDNSGYNFFKFRSKSEKW